MSDSMNLGRGLVVGTAGHIDHGKTSLIRALTGIDTDRLAEEKRRGISIDLGFAHLALDDGTEVSFIDVPGHERFVRNMLAGAGGMRAVMLIVAANESVMPQTREHFQICRLLNIRHGFVVITKIDLATPEQIRHTCDEVRELCAGSFLDGAPILPVSSATRQGLPELRAALTRMGRDIVTSQSGEVPRLWVDRSFVMKGFGTVITGTLLGGAFRSGDAIVIFPSRKSARIRSMQVHGHQVTTGFAGQRTAINITGIEASEVGRGDTVSTPEAVSDTHALDVWIEWLDACEIPEGRADFLFHIGAAEVLASVKVLQTPAAGSRTLARIWSPRPILAFPQDRFILRRPSPALTVAGGGVLDIAPPLRLNRARTVKRLEALLHGDSLFRIQFLVEESATGRKLDELRRLTGLTAEHLSGSIKANPDLLLYEPSQIVITKSWLGERRNRLVKWLTAFHLSHPSLPGATITQARLGLNPELAHIVFDKFPAIRLNGDVVALATHKPLFSEVESLAMSRIETAFREAGYQPPAIGEVLGTVIRDPKKARGLLETLLKNKRLVRVSDELVFHAEVMAHVRDSLAAHRGRRFSVPEFKEWTQMSRKFAIPVLEYLDRERVTRRDGDQRIIL